jgi:hypothetical protein
VLFGRIRSHVCSLSNLRPCSLSIVVAHAQNGNGTLVPAAVTTDKLISRT